MHRSINMYIRRVTYIHGHEAMCLETCVCVYTDRILYIESHRILCGNGDIYVYIYISI